VYACCTCRISFKQNLILFLFSSTVRRRFFASDVIYPPERKKLGTNHTQSQRDISVRPGTHALAGPN
jgi:hypothetical protein